MNILIVDSRMSTASLLAEELSSRNVSVTLAVSVSSFEASPEASQETGKYSNLQKISWNPFSWLSSDSLIHEASDKSALDALVLLFDLEAFAPFFSGLSYIDIFLYSVGAFQMLTSSTLKRFQAKKGGRIVFMLASRGNRAKPFALEGMQYIAASSAEAAFERFAEETSLIFSNAENSVIDTVLIKSEFDDEAFVSWAADCILGNNAKQAKASGKWLLRNKASGVSSIFQRKT